VVNEYTEEITVVVSKLRPSRLWAGAELNASVSGGGITLSTEVWLLTMPSFSYMLLLTIYHRTDVCPSSNQKDSPSVGRRSQVCHGNFSPIESKADPRRSHHIHWPRGTTLGRKRPGPNRRYCNLQRSARPRYRKLWGVCSTVMSDTKLFYVFHCQF